MKTLSNDNKRLVPPTQQARVLELLWIKYGGSFVLSGILGYSRTTLNAWKRITQKVPLLEVGKVSRALKVRDFLLNYTEVLSFYGEGDTWKSVVMESGKFDNKELKYIFSGKPPVEKK